MDVTPPSIKSITQSTSFEPRTSSYDILQYPTHRLVTDEHLIVVTTKFQTLCLADFLLQEVGTRLRICDACGLGWTQRLIGIKMKIIL